MNKKKDQSSKIEAKKPLLVSIPHSGEQVGEEAYWLKGLDEVTLMYDVDRFIDRIYAPALELSDIPKVITPWHRYLVDCNRWPTDTDCDSLEGSLNPSGSHPTGLHWRVTTAGHVLIPKPLSQALHKTILEKYYKGFFEKIDALYESFKQKGTYQKRFKHIYHLDLHSMPSQGTKAHRDPGEERADIVVGNEKGQTAGEKWTQEVMEAYEREGFKVRLNYPYTGGTIVEKYGQVTQGHQALMIELNRKLYMDEKTKKLIPQKAKLMQEKLSRVIADIYHSLPDH